MSWDQPLWARRTALTGPTPTTVRVLDAVPRTVAALAALPPTVWGAWTAWVFAFGGTVPGVGARPEPHLRVGLGFLVVVTPFLALGSAFVNHLAVSALLAPVRALVDRRPSRPAT